MWYKINNFKDVEKQVILLIVVKNYFCQSAHKKKTNT